MESKNVIPIQKYCDFEIAIIICLDLISKTSNTNLIFSYFCLLVFKLKGVS